MIVIVDYGLGNILNVQRAVQHLGYDVVVSRDPAVIERAEQLILPGVGHFKDAMQAIDRYELAPLLKRQQKPIIGICLGMQLLYAFSEEGHVPGLGFFEGHVRVIDTPYTVPHLGWNQLKSDVPGLDKDVYYVHTYQAPMNDDVVAYTDYGTQIPGIVQRGPYIGIQFHPEKSGNYGLDILAQALKGGWQHD
ncbi:imidazole glycerol phosphate synthase subunit HisH [Staphylococcus pseudintermedius]|uniref:imidazole glycerol phosphate synthase subunit HisH n=1 Tax=Staphylococcus pseudintermedius TaxID=283734 RepID=UPI002B25D099|nr:imidazole glycerol phosphate synthase subunit HisH [Staphylococcus pseudintermedius]WQL43463.1 imidazole glycerol phosphate synthase subunit HisH [Staphylococcus pseudintermedius]WQL45862.1 imidazole glycerol phosphate synthase subunit HisH [Staphylococcus pseudintermedius]